jgi:uncharacterized low-complexity protein
MENKTKLVLKGSLLAGSIISLGALQANANELIRAENLGSGGEVRATLLASERTLDNAIELKCGEKEESKAKEETKKSESKTKEAKCGEGKCGEGKCGEHSKKEESKEAEKSESKAEEHKCGEGKCGEGKCGM